MTRYNRSSAMALSLIAGLVNLSSLRATSSIGDPLSSAFYLPPSHRLYTEARQVMRQLRGEDPGLWPVAVRRHRAELAPLLLRLATEVQLHEGRAPISAIALLRYTDQAGAVAPIVEVLRTSLRDPRYSELTRAAVMHLASTGKPEVVPVLAGLVDTPARFWAVQAMDAMSSPEAVPLLVRVLTAPVSPSEAEAAIDALGRQGTAAARDALAAAFPMAMARVTPGSVEAGLLDHANQVAVARCEAVSSRDADLLLQFARLQSDEDVVGRWWGIEQVVRLDLRKLAPDLRQRHTELLAPVADNPTRRRIWLQLEYSLALLRAIHQLGGPLSEEETALLTDLGILPMPAGAPQPVDAAAAD